MKTDDLTALLASQAGPIDRTVMARRYAWAIGIAAFGAFILMLARFGTRPDLASVVGTPLFWIKLAFPAVVAVGAFLVTVRLSRPGMRVEKRWTILAIPMAAVGIAALWTLGFAPASERLGMLLGQSWRTCALNIISLAMPGFLALFWAVKGMAPTRLRAAGAAAGLLAGAVATIAYCLHCPEMEVAFWAVWYVAGMLVPAAVGALLGPWLLRW